MKKILIVDDDPTICELVSATLEIGPYQIFTASSGPAALAIAQAKLPEMILLDVQMPGAFDGIETCRRLKSDPRTAHIYVVMVTAKGQPWDRDIGYAAGADGYFAKPFSPLELMRKVEEVLDCE
ncbi:MAG: response regulator [Anaerolineae bacterium]|nr:response regulator [Anaerolineae bacterium]